MPNSKAANQEKKEAFKVIERYTGPLATPENLTKRDCKTTAKGTLIWLVFSTFHPKQNHYWFGLSLAEVAELSNEYEAAFLIFVLETHDDMMIIPLDVIRKQIAEQDLTKDKKGNVKLHLEPNGDNFRFSKLTIDASDYYKQYSCLKGN